MRFEKHRWCREVGDPQQLDEWVMCLSEYVRLRCSAAQFAPKTGGPSKCELAQLVLIPADQRRDEKAGEAEIVVRLHRELYRSQQVLHR